MVFEFLAIPHARFTAEDVNRGFMTGVLMGLTPRTGRNGRDLQVDSARTHGLSGDAGRVQVSVFADELLPSL
jgi:hypothetical protein